MSTANDILQKTENFLDEYYANLNGKSHDLSKMYASTSQVTWPDSTGAIVNLKSGSRLDSFLPELSERSQYKVTESFVQPSSGRLFLLVRGIRTEATNSSTCSFVQSFLLCEEDEKILILNDILLLKDECVSNLDAGIIVDISEVFPVAESAAPDKRSDSQNNLPVAGLQTSNVSDPEKKYSVCIISSDRMMEHWPEYFCLGNSTRMLKHKCKSEHPEVPDRIGSIMRKLKADNLLERVQQLIPTSAPRDYVLKVHREEYLSFIEKLPLNKKDLANFKNFYTHDMFCSSGTAAASFLAAGAVIQACDSVAKGEYQKAFAIVRPPGHHASESKAEGFCYMNNVAIGVKYLLEILGIENVAVADFDVHHCNGTQKIFYGSNKVLVFSTYCSELQYPSKEEMKMTSIGEGKGEGYNVNVPLPAGFGDADLLSAWEELLLPLLAEFKPKHIILSAGFDSAEGDIGECHVTKKCFSTVVDKVVKAHSGGIILALEGGYELDMLADCVSHVVRSLLGDQNVILDEREYGDPSPQTVATINQVKVMLSKYWEVFK